MRLSEQGLLEQCWQEAGGPRLPPHHVYRLNVDRLNVYRLNVYRLNVYRLTASGLALARQQQPTAAAAKAAVA
jgi:hypothetical protein